jgi:hypothetical protein
MLEPVLVYPRFTVYMIKLRVDKNMFVATATQNNSSWWLFQLFVGNHLLLSSYTKEFIKINIQVNTHRIHVWYIYANIGGILMVNVTIYSIHGSYGIFILLFQTVWHRPVSNFVCYVNKKRRRASGWSGWSTDWGIQFSAGASQPWWL